MLESNEADSLLRQAQELKLQLGRQPTPGEFADHLRALARPLTPAEREFVRLMERKG